MKRYLGPILLGLAVAIVVHLVILFAIPRVLMNKSMQRIDRRGGDNTWIPAPRVTAASRNVVHPSPELAYSACVYDLRKGPVHMVVAPMSGYWSLALFDARTDNFQVFSDHSSPQGVDIWLVSGSAKALQPPAGVTIVHSPSNRGIALIRRHIEDAAEWPAIRKARSHDVCASVH